MTEYKDKLDGFNLNKKYALEVAFLSRFLSSGRLLDFGCGTGACIALLSLNFKIQGYDLIKHNPDFNYHPPFGKYSTIYLMHSIAHLDSPLETINGLKKHLLPNGKIIIITPNKDWLDNKKENSNYNPDETVVQHFCQYKLERLFKHAGMTVRMQGQFGARLGQSNERIFLIATNEK